MLIIDNQDLSIVISLKLYKSHQILLWWHFLNDNKSYSQFSQPNHPTYCTFPIIEFDLLCIDSKEAFETIWAALLTWAMHLTVSFHFCIEMLAEMFDCCDGLNVHMDMFGTVSLSLCQLHMSLTIYRSFKYVRLLNVIQPFLGALCILVCLASMPEAASTILLVTYLHYHWKTESAQIKHPTSTCLLGRQSYWLQYGLESTHESYYFVGKTTT